MLVHGTKVQRHKVSFALADGKQPPLIFVFLRKGEQSMLHELKYILMNSEHQGLSALRIPFHHVFQ